MEEWISEGNLEGLPYGSEDSEPVIAPSHTAIFFQIVP